MLISRSGFSDGNAAMRGLKSTSLRPEAAEKITVPITRPVYMLSGIINGDSAYIKRPAEVKVGIILIVFCILKCFEKNVNIKSTPNCVRKFISTSVPKSV